jgi:hypothetical protein
VISFRYHVVSLVAVLLALAAGIALGSGPLQRSETDGAGESTEADQLVAAEARADEAQEALTFSDSYALATAPGIVGARLANRAVTLVRRPGADDAAVTGLTEMVERAGGAVTARVELGERLLDVANRQLVAELATQMHASAEGVVQVPAGASGYERMGLLLAHAVAAKLPAGAPLDDTGDSILAGVSTADLVTTQGNIERRGSLVLAVSGEPYGTADQRTGSGSIVNSLLNALDQGSAGVVLAGPVGSAAPDGLVGALRSDPTNAGTVSSVDVADRVAGAVVAVLALVGEVDGIAGHYGTAAAADGAVPQPPAADPGTSAPE